MFHFGVFYCIFLKLLIRIVLNSIYYIFTELLTIIILLYIIRPTKTNDFELQNSLLESY